jgi:hypothetical protein
MEGAEGRQGGDVTSHNNGRWASQGGGGADAPADHLASMVHRNTFFQESAKEAQARMAAMTIFII